MDDMITFPALIAALFKLVTKLVQVRHANLKSAVEECIEPFNEQFVEIHEAYLKMICDFRHSLPDLRGIEWSLPGTLSLFGVEFRNAEVRRVTKQALDKFKTDRQEFESSRDRFRACAKEVLEVSNDKDYRRFFCSVFYYFLDTTAASRDDGFYDYNADAIVTTGGISALATPSERLMLDLSAAQSPLEMVHLADHARQVLERRFSDTQIYFTRLKGKVAKGA